MPLSDLSRCCGELDRQTATVEGVFVLRAAGRGPPRAPPADLQPSVGLALTLRREPVGTLSLTHLLTHSLTHVLAQRFTAPAVEQISGS